MMQLNRRLAANPTSGIRRIGEMAKTLPGCIALTIGEPDFDAPVPIRMRVAAAILGGETHYPPTAGYSDLRAQVAAHLNARFGSDYAPEETVITVGSTQALLCSLLAILNPGDEVIVLTPAFGLYKPQIELAGGVDVPLPTGHGLTRAALSARITDRTRAILFASPNNPNGEVLPQEALVLLREAALAHDLFLLCDSVYDRLVYDAPLPTLMGDPALRDRLIYVSGLSKSHAATGLRVGYAAADAPVMNQLIKAHSFAVVSVPGCIQRGCVDAFDVDISGMTAAYAARRQLVYDRLRGMGLDVRLPGGAFYIYPSIARFGMDSDTFCDRLMREGGLALIPASCFGDEGHVRISYCYREDVLTEGMNRLESFIRGLES